MSLEQEFRAIWFKDELWRCVRDAAAAEDREWFEAHPHVTERLRPYVPGEGDSADSFLIAPPEEIIVQVFRNGYAVYKILDPIGPDGEWGPPAAFGPMEELDLDEGKGEAA